MDVPTTGTSAQHGDLHSQRGSDPTPHVAGSPPRWLRQALVVAGGVCLFALIGSIINPEWSRAGDTGRQPAPRVKGGGSAAAGPGAARSMPVAESSSLIGTLECREYRILIHHADPVPLYTVCTPDGRVLREKLQAEDVYREFPTIDLKRLYLDPSEGEDDSGPLMLVYPTD